MDLVATAPGGAPARAFTAAGIDPSVVEHLVAGGILVHRGERYSFRAGIWREWRLAVLARTQRAPGGRLWWSSRLIRTLATRALLVALGVFAGALAYGTALLEPTSTFTATDCGGPTAGLVVRASYPSYVSSGDEQELKLVVANAGPAVSVDGLVVVGFPDGTVAVTSANSVEYDVLRPGEQRTQAVRFVSAVRTPLFGSTPDVPVQVAISAGGTDCPPAQWSMRSAPVPHVQVVQQVTAGLTAGVGVPLLIEFLIIRRLRRHEPRPPAARGATKGA
jgi:hypothetical protein